jgi:hypothetical protein
VIDTQKRGAAQLANASNNGQSSSRVTIQFWEMISMATYQTHILNEISAGHDGPQIPPAKLAYFQERLRERVFDFLLGKFLEAQSDGLTQAKLSRRIGKKAEVVNRWLGAPSNLTLDSVSDLLIGIAAEELNLHASTLLGRSQVNHSHLDETPQTAESPHEPKQREGASAIDELMSPPRQDVSSARAAA